MFRPAGARLRLRQLRLLRLGPLRVAMPAAQPRAQLPLLPAEPDWQLLDQRERGTAFIAVGTRTILNSPASTHMGFWSINPYIGCEFGCTYCYARDTHRYAVEREQERAQSEGSTPTLL